MLNGQQQQMHMLIQWPCLATYILFYWGDKYALKSYAKASCNPTSPSSSSSQSSPSIDEVSRVKSLSCSRYIHTRDTLKEEVHASTNNTKDRHRQDNHEHTSIPYRIILASSYIAHNPVIGFDNGYLNNNTKKDLEDRNCLNVMTTLH